MSQDPVQSFIAYAAAFEEAFAANDWHLVEPYLTPDAVSVVEDVPPPIGGRFAGRDAVLAAFKDSCASFDRRFDTREPKIVEGPLRLGDDGVYFTYVVTYRRTGLPPVELHGEEWDYFRDGQLVRHRERFSHVDEMLSFLAAHDAELKPVRA